VGEFLFVAAILNMSHLHSLALPATTVPEAERWEGKCACGASVAEETASREALRSDMFKLRIAVLWAVVILFWYYNPAWKLNTDVTHRPEGFVAQ
jgi:hypothetical protein